MLYNLRWVQTRSGIDLCLLNPTKFFKYAKALLQATSTSSGADWFIFGVLTMEFRWIFQFHGVLRSKGMIITPVMSVLGNSELATIFKWNKPIVHASGDTLLYMRPARYTRLLVASLSYASVYNSVLYYVPASFRRLFPSSHAMFSRRHIDTGSS